MSSLHVPNTWTMEDRHTFLLGFSSMILTLLWTLKRISQRRSVLVEPPPAPLQSLLPCVGHLYGLLNSRLQYFVGLGLKWRKPIISVALPGATVYVVSSASLLRSIHRQPKLLSTPFLVAQIVPKMIGASRRSARSFMANLGNASSGNSMLMEGIGVTKAILNSRTGTDMNYDTAKTVSRFFDRIEDPSKEISVDLWEWVKHGTIVTVGDSMYGEDNPFRRREIAFAFWEFVEDSIWLSATSLLPRWIVSRFLKGMKARENVVGALEDYFLAGSHAQGSPIVNAHYPIFSENVDHADIARFECANGLAFFANTVPTTFWAIFHIFSDPELLENIRSQIASITDTEVSADQEITLHKINTRKLKEATMLFSLIEEVCRHRATGATAYSVIKDTSVRDGANSYLLKEGGVVIIANKAIHTDKRIWGEDVDTFVPNRFEKKTPSHASLGFGRGANACCGKNFALYHIASFIGIIVMRYDISPLEDEWSEPGQDARDSIAQVAPPNGKPLVKFTPREDSNRVLWTFDH